MIYLFDQYQRYKNVQLYIETLRKNGETLNILEVGANAHKNLKQFLPDDTVTYLDIHVPEELQDDEDYVQGDATEMTFPDSTFDVIVALDVYEHIPVERRQAFLEEIVRVSSRGFFICAPFDEEGVHEAECRVNAVYKCIYGHAHPWLEEHLTNGLPDLQATEHMLRDMGVRFCVFSHGDLDLWERMTNIEIAAECDEGLREVGMLLHNYYNQYLFENDYVLRAYRYFIVGGKKKPDFTLQKAGRKKKLRKKFAVLEEQFWALYAGLGGEKKNGIKPAGIFQMFYDSGSGMGVGGVQEMALQSHHVSFSREFYAGEGEQILTLRLDPMIHGGMMKIHSLNVQDAQGNVLWQGCPDNAQCRNLFYHYGQYYCFMEDPQICLEHMCCDNVTVEFDYEFWECLEGMEEFWQTFAEGISRERLMQENEEIQRIKENCDNEIHAVQEQHQSQMQLIYQSTSWKITKPYRFLARLVKKAGRLFLPERMRKALYILLHQGIRACMQSVSDYFDRKRAEKNIMKLFCPSERELAEQREHVFDRNILFSIIVPLYNTPEKYLREMIASCQAQTYRNWELCLADGSDRKHAYVENVVSQLAAQDSRIRYKVLDSNGGISENTNAALEMASGEYIALLDHDDVLHQSALYEYMKVICEQGADFIYCDEMTFQGKISHVVTLHFKPDFAIDNLRANNYICHFSVFSKDILKMAGMFRKEFDGSQDHDMILRLTEKAENIVHIPKILYFWRSHPASVASDINSKTYAIDAGKRAVLSHLERCGLRGSVESSWAFPTIYRIKYQLRSYPKISIIIPNKDHVEMLSRCIHSIINKSTYSNFEIVVVENNSVEKGTFDYYDKLQSISNVRVLSYEDKGFNYARINNFAVSHVSGEYLLFLNNDIEIITPEWLEEMLMFAQREDVGAVGAKLYYPDDKIQHAGIVLGLGEDRCAGSVHHRFDRENVGYIGRLCYAQDFSAVTAACLLVSKEIFQAVGGFDEQLAVAYNDVDLCMAIREAGYLNVWTPCAEAYHYESVSRGYEETPEKQERFHREAQIFREKWQAQLAAGDPYYNQNLTLDLPDFSPRRDIF